MNTETNPQTEELIKLRAIAKEYALLSTAMDKALAQARSIAKGNQYSTSISARVVNIFDDALLQHRTAQIIKGIKS